MENIKIQHITLRYKFLQQITVNIIECRYTDHALMDRIPVQIML